jgi:hypothetical protein
MGAQVRESGALDRLFDVLSDPYRRRILLLVSDRNPRNEDEFTPEDLGAEYDEFEFLETDLFHKHLPKLADAGYITWDQSTHLIRRGPRFGEIQPLLRLIHDHRDELPVGWP